MANWIQLASGGAYDFERSVITGPFTADADIAGPLSGLNRFVNHTTRPWDVAAHSVAVARTLLAITEDVNIAAAGLLHEAHEAVIGDIPTPVAWELGYDKVKALKRSVQAAIYRRLDTPLGKQTDTYKGMVEFADHAALYVEKQLFMVPEPAEWSVAMPSHEWMLEMHRQTRDLVDELGYAMVTSRSVFMNEYRRLVNEVA